MEKESPSMEGEKGYPGIDSLNATPMAMSVKKSAKADNGEGGTANGFSTGGKDYPTSIPKVKKRGRWGAMIDRIKIIQECKQEKSTFKDISTYRESRRLYIVHRQKKGPSAIPWLVGRRKKKTYLRVFVLRKKTRAWAMSR